MNDVGHFASNGSNLGRRRIGGFLDLIRAAFGESNGEETDEVIICRLHSHIGFNKSLPFTNEGSKFIGSEIEAVEVGQTIFALDLVYAETNLSERVLLILLEIREGHLNDATLQRIVCVLKTSRAIHQSLANAVRLATLDLSRQSRFGIDS